jgi:hypothetical protein
MAITRLRRILSARETTWGTAVTPATAKWMGVTDLSVTPFVERRILTDELRGSLQPAFQQFLSRSGVEWKAEGFVTYEDVLFILMGGLGVVTPTGTGPYTWTFTAPSTTWTPQAYTLQIGHDGEVFTIAGGLINSFSLKGEAGTDGEWKWSVEGIGKSFTQGTSFTGTPADRQVVVTTMPNTSFYMDAIGTTPGTTAFSGRLISFSLDVKNGLHLKWFAGDTNPFAFGYDRVEGTLEITVEYAANVQSFVQSTLFSQGGAAVRISAASGTSSIQIDFNGALAANPDMWGDRDGNVIATFRLDGVYHTEIGSFLRVVVVNGVNALP